MTVIHHVLDGLESIEDSLPLSLITPDTWLLRRMLATVECCPEKALVWPVAGKKQEHSFVSDHSFVA